MKAAQNTMPFAEMDLEMVFEPGRIDSQEPTALPDGPGGSGLVGPGLGNGRPGPPHRLQAVYDPSGFAGS
jgi:hypothetical protein